MSSFISVPQRLKVDSEQWARLSWQLLCDLRVAMPGIVKSFDALKQTVTVQPVIRENININLVSTPRELPLLTDIPIVVPRAGGYMLTVPVQAGDECLVIFADMCIDAWWVSGNIQNQADRRRHDLSDGFALLGCWSQPNVVSNYSTTALQVRNAAGDRVIEITPDKIHVVADKVDIEGGDITIHGSSVKINNKEFLTHQHTGVSTGGGNSGGVL